MLTYNGLIQFLIMALLKVSGTSFMSLVKVDVMYYPDSLFSLIFPVSFLIILLAF